MKKLDKLIFGLNCKNYKYGDELLEIAHFTDKLAKENPEIIFTFSAPYVDLARVCKETENMLIYAQGMDGISPGRGNGLVLPDSLKAVGVNGVTLNHAERPMTVGQLVKAVYRAKELGLLVDLCCDSAEEAKMLATLKPNCLICEPTSLIGTGKTASETYMQEVVNAIHAISDDIIICIGAGTKNGNDVYNAIKNGAQCAGGSSGIFAAENPHAVILDMLDGFKRAIADFPRWHR